MNADAGGGARRGRAGSPLGLGAGLLAEPEYGGPVLSGRAGVQAAVSRFLAVGAFPQRGWHGGERGPDLLSVALEYRAAP